MLFKFVHTFYLKVCEKLGRVVVYTDKDDNCFVSVKRVHEVNPPGLRIPIYFHRDS